MRINTYWVGLTAVLACAFLLTKGIDNEFYCFAAYVIGQGLIMAVAWNILGGFTG